MAVDLVATVGAADADSYLDLDAANAQMDKRLNTSAWTSAASDDDRKRALIEATRMIDANRLDGYRVTSTQRLEFPRNTQREPLTEIPDAVIQAVLDQALVLLAPNSDLDRANLQAQGVVSFSTGSHSETFGARKAANGGLCPRAVTRLGDWISRTGHIVGPRETPWGAWGGWSPVSDD